MTTNEGALANCAEFANEVQLVAAIAAVLQQPGMLDAEDGDYRRWPDR